MVTRWEYKIMTGENLLTEDSLNTLGNDGWELVGMSSHIDTGGVTIICVFKREKKGEPGKVRVM